MPTYEDTAAAIRSRFFDQVTSSTAPGIGVPTLFDNAPHFVGGDGEATDEPTTTWAMLTIQPGAANQVEIGSAGLYRVPGRAVASIFVPVESGEKPALVVVDRVNEAFRSAIFSGISFLTPDVERVGRTADSRWWQINVSAPYRADTIPT
jgi:hypothetical protein